MEYGKWKKIGGRYVYLWERPFFERNTQITRADYKPGLFELYFNAMTEEPINSIATRDILGKEFKKLFNASPYICVVSSSRTLIEIENRYKNNVQFYFRANELPSEETMSKVEDIINKCSVPAMYRGTDKKTKEVSVYSYGELPVSYPNKRRIFQECEMPQDKKHIICGCYWEYEK